MFAFGTGISGDVGIQLLIADCVNRDILMTLLSIMDPEGAKSKKDRRLKRRVYVNEVLNLRI